jgi:hypothetical protein
LATNSLSSGLSSASAALISIDMFNVSTGGPATRRTSCGVLSEEPVLLVLRGERCASVRRTWFGLYWKGTIRGLRSSSSLL